MGNIQLDRLERAAMVEQAIFGPKQLMVQLLVLVEVVVGEITALEEMEEIMAALPVVEVEQAGKASLYLHTYRQLPNQTQVF